MSGPIVRKYGFPNFEKIFGERPIEHGVDEAADARPAEAGSAESKSQPTSPKNPARPGESKPS
jgi:hypothetical protein